MYISLSICIYIYIYIHTYIHITLGEFGSSDGPVEHAQPHGHLHECLDEYINMYVCVCIYIYMYVYMFVCIYIYIYMRYNRCSSLLLLRVSTTAAAAAAAATTTTTTTTTSTATAEERLVWNRIPAQTLLQSLACCQSCDKRHIQHARVARDRRVRVDVLVWLRETVVIG